MSKSLEIEAGLALGAGRYVLRAPLGRGAMGEVWRATDERLGRDVAFKFVSVAARPELSIRLRDEARAAARIRHECLVEIYDFGESEELGPWYVSELLPGESLADRLAEDGPMLPRRILDELAPDLLGALAALHDGGMVHRDVKPGNLLLGAQGRYRLADLGLALFQGREAKTATGIFVGSPAYLAPEQLVACARELGPEVDVYASALLLIEALTGRLPFRERDLIGLLKERAETELDLARLRSMGVAGPWAKALEPALLRDPASRLSDPRKLLEGLRSIHDESGSETGAPRATRVLGAPPKSRGEAATGEGAMAPREARPALERPVASPLRRFGIILALLGGIGLVGLGLHLRSKPALPFVAPPPVLVPEVDGKDADGEARVVAALLARNPLHRPEALASLDRFMAACAKKAGPEALRSLRRMEQRILDGGGSLTPAQALIRNRRMALEGEASALRRLRPLIRSSLHCLKARSDGGADGRADGGGDEDREVLLRLLASIDEIARDPGAEPSVRTAVDRGLDELAIAMRALPFPGETEHRSKELEELLRSLQLLSWRWAWKEDFPEAVTEMKSGELDDEQARMRFVALHLELQGALRRALDAHRESRVALGSMDPLAIQQCEAGIVSGLKEGLIRWYGMEQLLRAKLARSSDADALRRFCEATRDLTPILDGTHLSVRASFLAWRRPFSHDRLAGICHRSLKALIRQTYLLEGRRDSTLRRVAMRLAVLSSSFGYLEILQRRENLELLKARWFEVEDGFVAGDSSFEGKACRILPFDMLGRRDEAFALARTCLPWFIGQCEAQGVEASMRRIHLSFLNHVGTYLLRRSVAAAHPEVVGAVIVALRKRLSGEGFLGEEGEEPQIRENLLRRCREAEDAILQSAKEMGP